jgi:hypothetical protein
MDQKAQHEPSVLILPSLLERIDRECQFFHDTYFVNRKKKDIKDYGLITEMVIRKDWKGILNLGEKYLRNQERLITKMNEIMEFL